MRNWAVAAIVAGMAFLPGCKTTDDSFWTWNQRQALARSGGDVAMTALIDQGVNKAEAVEVCMAILRYVESGDMSKAVFQKYVLEKIPPAYVDWADALFVVLDNVGLEEQIPPEVRTALISFLRDGAIYGASLYKDGHKPTAGAGG